MRRTRFGLSLENFKIRFGGKLLLKNSKLQQKDRVPRSRFKSPKELKISVSLPSNNFPTPPKSHHK